MSFEASLIVKTYEELDKWLSDNYYFEDGHILSIDRNPLSIRVGYNISGNYRANSEREILVYRITPFGIMEWAYDEQCFTPSENDYIEDITPIEAGVGVGLKFTAPKILHLRAKEICIEKEKNIKTIFKPWISQKNLFVQSTLKKIPRPDFWRQKLKEFGHDILFRFYCGNQKLPEELPYPDYSGYFIQLRDKISHTKEGIFIRAPISKGERRIYSF